MILNEQDTNNIRINFFYSEAEECLVSLHVMSNPEHHTAAKDWARNRYEMLSEELKHEIDFFGANYADWLFIMDIASYISQKNYPNRLTVEKLVQEITDMDDEQFAYLFLGFPAFDYDINIVRRWIKDPSAVNEKELGVQAQFLSTDSVRLFVEDIDGMKARIKDVLFKYWEECFSKEWPAIDRYLGGIVKKEELIFQRTNFNEYITQIHEDLTAADNFIVFHKDPDYSVNIKNIKDILINLSVFSAPHLMGNVVGQTMTVTLNLNFHSVKMQEAAPERVLKILDAVSDSTRLKIMKMLWNSETTTKELAEVLDLSPSTISLHLKILREADLVETNKIKKYVYYRLKKEEFKLLQDSLIGYFEY